MSTFLHVLGFCFGALVVSTALFVAMLLTILQASKHHDQAEDEAGETSNRSASDE